jgi:hypothetical protein
MPIADKIIDILGKPVGLAELMARYGKDAVGIGANTVRPLLPAVTKAQKAERAVQRAIAEGPLPEGAAEHFARGAKDPMYYKLGSWKACEVLGLTKHAWGPVRGEAPTGGGGGPVTYTPPGPVRGAGPAAPRPAPAPAPAKPAPQPLNRAQRGLRQAGLE